MPSLWRKFTTKPIPKGSTTDPRLPLQYRGIALLSTVYKIYTCTWNNRIVSYMEENGLYAEEKNWFRQGRSCSEHLFVLTTIIRNGKLQGKSTFTALRDAEKAFDRADRELLLFKLLNLGIKGHICENIKAIYKEAICCINVNNMLTDWFQTYNGIIQGDTLLPTLFNIFINDLVDDVNSFRLHVNVNGHWVDFCFLLWRAAGRVCKALVTIQLSSCRLDTKSGHIIVHYWYWQYDSHQS